MVSENRDAKVGRLLRLWASRHITAASEDLRFKQLAAAEYLAKQGSTFTGEFAYRAFALNIREVLTKDSLVSTVRTQYPESYSASIEGVRSFLKEGAMAAGGHLYVVFKVRFKPQDLLFNLAELANGLDPSERSVLMGGYSLKDYAPQEELVAKPGTLSKALTEGRVLLAGYETPTKRYWRKGLA